MENVWIHQESSRAFPVYFWIIRLLLTTRGVAPAGQWVFFLFPVFLPHTFHCVKFFFGGEGGFWGVIRPTFSESEILSPLCIQPPSPPPTPLSPVFSQLDWVQPLRLEARVYLELKRKLFRSCAPPGEGRLRFGRWGGAREDRGPGIWLFLYKLGFVRASGELWRCFLRFGCFYCPNYWYHPQPR